MTEEKSDYLSTVWDVQEWADNCIYMYRNKTELSLLVDSMDYLPGIFRRWRFNVKKTFHKLYLLKRDGNFYVARLGYWPEHPDGFHLFVLNIIDSTQVWYDVKWLIDNEEPEN